MGMGGWVGVGGEVAGGGWGGGVAPFEFLMCVWPLFDCQGWARVFLPIHVLNLQLFFFHRMFGSLLLSILFFGCIIVARLSR